MKKFALAVILVAAGSNAGFAQVTRPAEGCQAPMYMPPNCTAPTPRSFEAPRSGAFVRSPETGEQAGESTGVGLRGFGIRLPAVSLDLPEIRFPSLVKYRRNAEMHVEGSRAPWVEGRALEFNQVPRNLDDTPRSFDQQPRDMCIPPAPCTTETERQLRSELARREGELQQIQSRFDRLEQIVEKLAVSRQESNEVARKKSNTRAKRIIEAGYEEEDEPTQQPQPAVTRQVSREGVPLRKPAKVAQVSDPTTSPNVGHSYQAEDSSTEGLGVWKGEGQLPTSGAAKRSSR